MMWPDKSCVRKWLRRGGLTWVLCGMALPVGARSLDDDLEATLASARRQAVEQAASVTRAGEALRLSSAATVAALEEQAGAAKAELVGLQKELLAVLAKDETAGLRVVRARLAAQQAALEAAEGERALVLKNLEECERDRDAWKRRMATLELALRIDMKTMLAGTAEIEDREKRVDAALKDIEYQSGQVKKYQSRRTEALQALGELHRLLGELGDSRLPADPPDLRLTQEEHTRQLHRRIDQQKKWVRLNKQLEDRSRRNLAFARTEYLVSRRYADALAHKADLRRVAEAQAAAEAADAQLSTLRTGLTPIQQRLAGDLAEAARQSEQALKMLGEARTAPEQAQARLAYAAAQTLKTRWEVEGDCWKELAALQKAGAAFARELTDRARGVAEDRSIFDINQEERQLRESLDTSEQYVHSLEMMIQKQDSLIESDRRELGLSVQEVQTLAGPLSELFGAYDASKPPSPDLVADQFKALQATFSEKEAKGGMLPERRRDVGATMVVRLGQREMLRARKAISERWLENSRAAIRTLERLAGKTLWQQHDPRLNGMTCLEAGELLGAALSDGSFIWDCQRAHLRDVPGVPQRKMLGWSLALLLFLGVLGWGAGRLVPAGTGVGWFAGRLIGALPVMVGAALLALRLGSENLALRGVGLLLLGLAGGRAMRLLMRAPLSGHRSPPGATLAGGLFTAINAIALWTALLLPIYGLAAGSANPWDVEAVIERLWLFGLCVAAFRLALHPALMGRLLSRRSEHRGLRWLGTSVAIGCTLAAALAALPYLAGLDNLGGTVLHTVEASFAVLAGALVGTATAGWLMRRHAAQACAKMGWIRTVQTGVSLAAGAGVAWIWGQLLNRVVLAPNAPPLVQDAVRMVEHSFRAVLRVWGRELTPGMTVSSLARGLLIFALSFWVSRIVKRQFLERALARTPMDETTRVTFSTILGYLVILLGFLVGLNVAGSSLQNLALLAGAITVGLGFGLQNVINNFVSSLLIHFGRTIRVGDYIDVGGTRGTVREIGLRNTMIITDDGITVLVPNGSFVSANIINWTNPSRRTRLHVSLAVTRQADLTAVAELATTVARAHPAIMKDPAPVMEVRTVTAAQVTLELLAWTEKPERLASIVGELNLALDKSLREKGLVA